MRCHGSCAWGGMQHTQVHPLVGFAIQVAAGVRPVVERVGRRDRALADQLRRAVSSVVLNLAEALGSDAGNRRARLATARGSLCEARAAVQLAAAWGYIDDTSATSIAAQLDRLGARLFGVVRR